MSLCLPPFYFLMMRSLCPYITTCILWPQFTSYNMSVHLVLDSQSFQRARFFFLSYHLPDVTLKSSWWPISRENDKKETQIFFFFLCLLPLLLLNVPKSFWLIWTLIRHVPLGNNINREKKDQSSNLVHFHLFLSLV